MVGNENLNTKGVFFMAKGRKIQEVLTEEEQEALLGATKPTLPDRTAELYHVTFKRGLNG